MTGPSEAPADLDGLVEHVTARLSSLPPKLRRIGLALLDSPEMLAFGSIRELAGSLALNTATVVRFAQLFGFSGYQAMRTVVRRGYLLKAGLQPASDREWVDELSPAAAVREVQQNNLEIARKRLVEVDLAAVARAICAAQRVLITGTGGALVAGQLMNRVLRQVGLRGELIPASGAELPIGLHDIGPNDVLIAFTLWLPFQDVLRAVRFARGAGATTIAFAGSASSPIAAGADHVIVAPSQGGPLPFSVVATVALIEELGGHLAQQRPGEIERHDQALQDWYIDSGMMAPLLPRPAATDV